MDNRQKEIDNLKDYKYGFTTDIEITRAPKGLNEDVIRFISNIKKEPQWMLDFRLKAFERFKQLKEPDWQKPKYPKIDYQDLYYYSAPKSMKDKPKNLDDFPLHPLSECFSHPIVFTFSSTATNTSEILISDACFDKI